MRQYELMLVVRPDFESSDTKRVSELIKKVLGDLPAKAKDVTVLGKKSLAYPIGKLTEGTYILVNLEAEPLRLATLEKQMRLSNDVVRFLLTGMEGAVSSQSSAVRKSES